MKLSGGSLLVAVLVAALAAVPAHAASWSAAQRISNPAPFAGGPTLAFDAHGDGLFIWREGEPLPNKGRLSYAWRHPDGTFDPPQATSDGMSLGGISVAPDGQALLLAGHRVGRGEQIETYGARPGAALKRTQIVARSRHRPYFVVPLLAADKHGDAVAMWANGVGPPRRYVQIAVRSPGGRFGRPLKVSGPGAHTFTLGIAPNGRYVIAWVRHGRVEVRFGHGEHLSRVMRAGHLFKGLRNLLVSVAIDSAGNSIIAWNASGLELAYRPAGKRLGHTRRLGNRISNVIAPALLGRGHFLLVWDNGTGPGIHTRDFVNGKGSHETSLTGPAKLTDQFNLQSLALGNSGQVAVAWSRFDTSPGAPPGSSALFVSYRGPGEDFEPPEVVTAHPDDAFETDLGFDGDSVVAIWVAAATPEFIETSTRR